MSDDVATLGLAVDSSQVNAASAALDKLTASAAPAAQAAASLQSAAASASPALQNLSNATGQNSSSFLGQREALRGLTSDLALLGGSLGSTASTAAALYLGNQRLFEGYGSLTSAMSALLTPQNLLIGATVGLAIAGVELYQSILTQEQAFDDLHVRANTTLTDLHALASAASFQGIDNTDFLKQMTTFSDQTAQAANNMGSLGELLRANGLSAGTMEQNLSNVANLVKNASDEASKYQIIQEAGLPATRQWVDFLSQGAAGIQQAEAAAISFGGAADTQLIAKAKDFDQQWNTAWTNFKNFADNAFVKFIADLDDLSHNTTLTGLLSAAVGATPFGGIINSLLGAYNLANPTTPNTLVSGGFNALGNSGAGSSTFANQLLASVGGSTTAATTTIDPKVLQQQLSQESQSLSILGQLATVDDTVRQKEIQLQQAQLAGVPITSQAAAAILDYTQKQALGVIAIEQQTNAQKLQTDTIGMSVGDAAAYAAVQERINAAALAGNTLTAAQITELQKYATALGQATQQAALLKAQNDAWFQTMQLGYSNIMQPTITALHNLYGDDFQAHLNDAIAQQITLNTVLSQTKTIAGDAMDTFFDDLVQGKSAVVALQDALVNVEEQLIKIATNQVLSAAFGSGLSGIFGGLLGGGTSTAMQLGTAPATSVLGALYHTGGIVGESSMPGRYIHPAYFDDAPRFHSGGLVAGEVPIIAKKGEGVFTPQQMAAMAPANNSPNITIYNDNNFTGADPGTEARLKAYVDQRSKQTVSDAVTAVRQANSTSPSYLRNGR